MFDVLGRHVATQAAGLLPAGPQAGRWDAGAVRRSLCLVRLVVDGQPAASRQLVVD